MAGKLQVAVAKVDQHHVVVRAAGDQAPALLREHPGKRLGVGDYLAGVLGELRPGRLGQGDCLGEDVVHERPALEPGEDG